MSMEKQTLERMIAEGKSQRQIGKELGSCQQGVRYWMIKYGLKTKRMSVVKGGERVCGICGEKYMYVRSKGHTLTTCNSCSQVERRRKFVAKAVEYKGGRCVRCGYKVDIRALDFHHRDPSKKEFTLAGNIGRLSWSRVKAEVDKCDLLCANCHRCVDHSKL
jgi:hypothetical protein